MATNLLSAGYVMRQSAVLLNDVARSICPYSIQIPYLNMALAELQELFELNNVPVTDNLSLELDLPSGISELTFAPTTPVVGVSYLPSNFIEPILVWMGSNDSFTPMTPANVLSQGNYVWMGQTLQFHSSNQDNKIKINYVGALFTPVVDEDSDINIINAESFLVYRNAGLVAEFVFENKTRADDLNGFASLAMDRALGIGTKTRQAIVVRRRPFRAGYKNRL